MFQNLIGSLERSWAAMAEDLANLSAQNETLKLKQSHLWSKSYRYDSQRAHVNGYRVYTNKPQDLLLAGKVKFNDLYRWESCMKVNHKAWVFIEEPFYYQVILLSFQEVERKHEAMLQMYGEKAEEAEELKLDINDLKTMYRQQVRILWTA